MQGLILCYFFIKKKVETIFRCNLLTVNRPNFVANHPVPPAGGGVRKPAGKQGVESR